MQGLIHKLGAMSYVYPGYSAKDMASAMEAHGLKYVQLDPRQTELLEGDLFSVRRAREIHQIFAERGIQIIGLSGYSNILDPDPAKREANVAMLERMFELGEAYGSSYIATETGSLHPTNQWRHHPDNDSNEAWQLLLSTVERLRTKALRQEAVFLLEGFVHNVLSTPKRAESIMRALGSEGLGLVMDPFNFMTETDLEPDRQAGAIETMFRQIAQYCPIAHAKDAIYTEKGFKTPRAGTGRMDWKLTAAALVRHTPDVPLILEHLQAEEVGETLIFIRGQFEQECASR